MNPDQTASKGSDLGPHCLKLGYHSTQADERADYIYPEWQ